MPVMGAGLAFVALFFFLPLAVAGNPSPDGGIIALIQMGGAPQYLAIAMGSFVALGQALWVLFAVRAKPALAAALPLGPLVVFGFGTVGFLNGMRGALKAVEFVNPADKTTIVFAAMSEASCCIVLGGALAAVLWLGQGAALAVSALGRTAPASRVLMRVTAAASLGLGAWAVLDVLRAGAVAKAFRVATRSDPYDFDTLFPLMARSAAGWAKAGLAVAGVAALVTLALVGLGTARAKASVAVGASGAIAALTALLAAGVLAAQRGQGDELIALFAVRDVGPPPLEFRGEPAKLPLDVTLDGKGAHVRDDLTLEELFARSRGLDGEQGAALSVVMTKEADANALGTLLSSAQGAGFSRAQLVGRAPKRPMIDLPPLLQMVYDRADRHVATWAIITSEADGPAARITKAGVEIEGKTLAFADWGPVDPEPDRDAIVDVWPGSVQPFVRGLVTLRHGGYRPVLRVNIR
jgi:hypothetical protein